VLPSVQQSAPQPENSQAQAASPIAEKFRKGDHCPWTGWDQQGHERAQHAMSAPPSFNMCVHDEAKYDWAVRTIDAAIAAGWEWNGHDLAMPVNSAPGSDNVNAERES
jgi:hypothetical protein